MNEVEQRIVGIFRERIKGRKPDVSASNSRHDGKYGHWLETQFAIGHNASNSADLFGYELKNETGSKTTFGDWSANEYIYNNPDYFDVFDERTKLERREHFLDIFGKANEAKGGRRSWSGEPCPKIYIVGFDKRRFGLSDDFRFEYPVPPKTKTRLGDILESSVDPKYTISDKLYEGHLRRKREHLEKGNGFGFSLFDADSPYTSTISARYYKDGSEILVDQGKSKNPRKLTPRECARLQGFPETFIIPVSATQAYKQFGNSVAVPVVRAVAKRMVDSLKNID